jgi:hypothetical protein
LCAHKVSPLPRPFRSSVVVPVHNSQIASTSTLIPDRARWTPSYYTRINIVAKEAGYRPASSDASIFPQPTALTVLSRWGGKEERKKKPYIGTVQVRKHQHTFTHNKVAFHLLPPLITQLRSVFRDDSRQHFRLWMMRTQHGPFLYTASSILRWVQ